MPKNIYSSSNVAHIAMAFASADGSFVNSLLVVKLWIFGFSVAC
jgi:hypothetical protein